ncbi:hypothetical protein A3Q56_07940 [Intoshia linei]|uniref:SURP motif domain-containing protein n=1 Tax=Intoshia linei TaxID=1819745 RepID=A0A177ASI0_9BILA|nr:hypothetical protein A3Q56_07940 [Intoshia linei]
MDLRIPDDIELRRIIDRTAIFVARNGSEFEEMTRRNQYNNPSFAFLFGNEYTKYYSERLSLEQGFSIDDSNKRISPTNLLNLSNSNIDVEKNQIQMDSLNRDLEQSHQNLLAQEQVIKLQKEVI